MNELDTGSAGTPSPRGLPRPGSTPRCPHCGAAAARDVAWCTQCYGALAAAVPPVAPEPPPAPETPPAPRRPLVSDETASRAWTARARLKAADGVVTGMGGPQADDEWFLDEEPEPVDPQVEARRVLDDELERLGDTMLAGLSESQPPGRVQALVGAGVSRRTRVLVVAAGVVVLSGVGLLLMAVAGLAV